MRWLFKMMRKRSGRGSLFGVGGQDCNETQDGLEYAPARPDAGKTCITRMGSLFRAALDGGFASSD